MIVRKMSGTWDEFVPSQGVWKSALFAPFLRQILVLDKANVCLGSYLKGVEEKRNVANCSSIYPQFTLIDDDQSITDQCLMCEDDKSLNSEDDKSLNSEDDKSLISEDDLTIMKDGFLLHYGVDLTARTLATIR